MNNACPDSPDGSECAGTWVENGNTNSEIRVRPNANIVGTASQNLYQQPASVCGRQSYCKVLSINATGIHSETGPSLPTQNTTCSESTANGYVVSASRRDLRGIYAKTPSVCFGHPVYQKVDQSGAGPFLLLTEKSSELDKYETGLYWILRSAVDDGSSFTQPNLCTFHDLSTTLGVLGPFKAQGMIDSRCSYRPDNDDMHWNTFDNRSIQILPTSACTEASTCGCRATGCFHLPSTSHFTSASCIRDCVKNSGTVSTDCTRGCRFCSCQPGYIGEQYCTTSFWLDGANNDRYNGVYVHTRDTWCNGKPVFWHLTYDAHRNQVYGPMLFQPSGKTEWIISDCWDQHQFSLASNNASSNGHCPDTNAFIWNVNDDCSGSPDGTGCAGGWIEDGGLNSKLRIRPYTYTYAPTAPRVCTADCRSPRCRAVPRSIHH